tara:strand:- start:53 stop:343 length:291 start_codon:yes stop_codon:yes gene_type:complete
MKTETFPVTDSDVLMTRGRLTKSNSIDLPTEWKDIIDPDTVTVHLTQIAKSQDLIVYDYIFFENKIFVRSGHGSDTMIDCYYIVFADRQKTTVVYT